VNAYLAVVSARYRTLLQYRAAAFAGFVTQLFWGGVRIMVLMAFYAVGSDDQPMSLTQVVAYVWLGQALLGMFPWSVDTEIAEMIRTGAVSYELVRPLDLYYFWFSRTIALRTATTTLRCLPMLVFAMILLPLLGYDQWALQPPPDAIALFAFLVSVVFALMLACAITMLMHVVLVWSLNGDGINRILPSFAIVLSGNVLPLPLFPDWLQPFLELQPFQGLVDTPFRIYCGNITGFRIVTELCQQLLWATALIVYGRWALNRITRNLMVQGG
jgi:ABC-2 type transport system permease protein